MYIVELFSGAPVHLPLARECVAQLTVVSISNYMLPVHGHVAIDLETRSFPGACLGDKDSCFLVLLSWYISMLHCVICAHDLRCILYTV